MFPHSPIRLFLAAVCLALTGCATGYHSRPLLEKQVLRDLQTISLEALQPAPLPEKVKPLGAGTPLDPASGISVEQAVAIAEYLNPNIRTFRAERGVAEGELVSARLIANPELQFSLLHIQNFTKNLGTAGVDSALNWAPPRPGERAARIRRAQAHVDAVRAEISSQEWMLASEVRKAYYTMLAFEERRKFAEASLKLQKRVLDYYDAKYKLGDTSRLDLNLANLAYGDALRELQSVISEAERASQEFNRLLGLPPLHKTNLSADTGRLSYQAFSADLPTLENAMVEQEPELLVAKQEYAEAEQSVRIARYERWPWFRFGPSFRREEIENGSLLNEFGVDFGLELPLFNFNQGEIQRTEADRERLYDAYVAKVHEKRAELNEAYRNLLAQERLIQVFHTNIQPALDENRELMESAFRLKDVNVLQVLTAQDRALRTQSEFVQAELEYWKSVFDLEKSVGAPIMTGAKP